MVPTSTGMGGERKDRGEETIVEGKYMGGRGRSRGWGEGLGDRRSSGISNQVKVFSNVNIIRLCHNKVARVRNAETSWG